MISIKNKEQLQRMRRAGALVRDALELIAIHIRTGITTADLDALAYDFITSNNAYPSFKGYNGYPASICASIEDEVVHGIPSPNRKLNYGEIISIDIGAYLDGYHGDAARTFMIGEVDKDRQKLIQITEKCFFDAVKIIKAGTRIGDIGAAVQKTAEENGYSVVRELVGHGIGTKMHEDPSVPNYGRAGTGVPINVGMTIAIEPMINMGGREVEFLADGWTVRTKDRKPSAHYENTIALTDNGVEILTL